MFEHRPESTLYLDSPVGTLQLQSFNQCISGLRFVPQENLALFAALEEKNIHVCLQTDKLLPKQKAILPNCLIAAYYELQEYFFNKRTTFSLPLFLQGSPFQKKVWQKAQEIPYGTTISYKELAHRCGSPKAARAVGTALKNNPIALFVPCHRIIAQSGAFQGFFGGLEAKKYLLSLEGLHFLTRKTKPATYGSLSNEFIHLD